VEGLPAAVEEVVGLTPPAAASVMAPGALLERGSRCLAVLGTSRWQGGAGFREAAQANLVRLVKEYCLGEVME
jgi:hypothetical protein